MEGMPRYCHFTRFSRMFVLAVATNLFSNAPAIGFHRFDDVSNFSWLLLGRNIRLRIFLV